MDLLGGSSGRAFSTKGLSRPPEDLDTLESYNQEILPPKWDPLGSTALSVVRRYHDDVKGDEPTRPAGTQMRVINRILEFFLLLAFGFALHPNCDEHKVPGMDFARYWKLSDPWRSNSHSKRPPPSSSSTPRRRRDDAVGFYDESPQVIAGRYVDGKKLRRVLNTKFPSGYKLQMRSNTYRLYAPGRLTDEDISYCL